MGPPFASEVFAFPLRLRSSLPSGRPEPTATSPPSGALERRFAALSGLPLRRLPRYHGSAVTWENHRLPGSTAFVVELPAGPPSGAQLRRYVRAARSVAGLA